VPQIEGRPTDRKAQMAPCVRVERDVRVRDDRRWSGVSHDPYEDHGSCDTDRQSDDCNRTDA